MQLSNPRTISITIALVGITLLAFGGLAALLPDDLLPSGLGLAALIVVVLALLSIVLAAAFLVLMCFAPYRSAAVLWLGAVWIIPLFVVLGWFGAFWLPVAIAAPAFTLASIAFMQRDTSQPGKCTRCGYDLTGIPQKAPCPECGEGRA